MRPGPSSCWPSYGVSAGEGGPTFGVRKQWICGSKLRPIIGKPSLVVLQCWRFLGYRKHLIFHTFSVFYLFVYLLVVLDLFLHSFWNRHRTNAIDLWFVEAIVLHGCSDEAAVEQAREDAIKEGEARNPEIQGIQGIQAPLVTLW